MLAGKGKEMIFRVTRHTNQLDVITKFYVNVIGLRVLGGFNGHDNYDGVFLGKEDLGWHLEFTQSNELPNHTFDEDDALVFYPSTQDEFEALLLRINDNNIEIINHKNPYWHQNGIAIRDPEGQIVVISPLRIRKTELQSFAT